MAWYLNHYTCDRCGGGWSDEWSCMCDDDCPQCGARHMSPYASDNLTWVVEQQGERFVALRSPDDAEHGPQYLELVSFAHRAQAEHYIANTRHLVGL